MRPGVLVVMCGLCCACGRLGFEPQGGARIGDGGNGDGPPGDGSGSGSDGTVSGDCLPPGNASTFPGGLPCADWAANPQFTNASLSESGGTLLITPNANTVGAQGGCLRSAVPFGAGGAIIEVSAVLTGTDTITAVQLGLGAEALSMVVQNGMLLAQDASGTLGQVPYSPATTRFWRIRPANQIRFEYGDGATWSPLATTAQAAPASYDFRVIAGEIGGVPNPGTARFESVNLCP